MLDIARFKIIREEAISERTQFGNEIVAQYGASRTYGDYSSLDSALLVTLSFKVILSFVENYSKGLNAKASLAGGIANPSPQRMII